MNHTLPNYVVLRKQARRFLVRNSGCFSVPESMFIFALSEIEIEPEHLHDLEIEHLSGDRYGFLISFPYIINDSSSFWSGV